MLVRGKVIRGRSTRLCQCKVRGNVIITKGLLTSKVFNVIAKEPKLILIFLLFCTSLEDCDKNDRYGDEVNYFLVSVTVLFVPICACRPMVGGIPGTIVLLVKILTIMVVVILTPIRDVGGPLSRRREGCCTEMARYVATLRMYILVVLFYLSLRSCFCTKCIDVILVTMFVIVKGVTIGQCIR